MLKILIADDDPDIREALVNVAKIFGHDTIAVKNGKEALEIHDDYSPDLILLDNFMGTGILGIDVLGILKKKKTSSLIVIVTASRDIELAVKAMKLGAMDFITKPLDIVKMEELFNKVIDTKNETKTTTNVVINLKENEIVCIKNAIDECETYQQAADKLGMSLETLWRKRKRYGIHKDGIKDAKQKVEKLLKKYMDKEVA